MKFLKQVQAEMAKVVWPNRNTTMLYTFITVLVSLFIAYYLGALDFVFTNFGLKNLIR